MQQPLNQTTWFIFINLASSGVLICVFHILEANSFKEYMDAIYSSTTSISFTIQFVALVFDMENLFIVIGTIDEIGNNSESTFES